jgi:ArsR family transcriptional regulator
VLYRLQAEFCKGMAHPKRIQLLQILKGGERSVGDLAQLTRIPQANVSQHLAILRQFGLLNTRRDGANIYYSISDRRVIEACELVRSCIGERVKKSQLILTMQP